VTPNTVLLTVPESSLASDSDTVAEIVDHLTSFGLQLGIEDFGMGNSALGHLHRFPLTTVRLARSFLNDIGDSEERWRIVDALHSLGRGLGMRVIVDGIEHRAQLARLSAIGVDYGQGKLFSPPVNAESIGRMLGDGRLGPQ
jgi:EAL domain-containing protein (putative c-di-GMP-specific phosphodiesterase class I)